MANIGTREKIIIGVMGIAILYAAVDLMMPKKKDIDLSIKQKKEELETFMGMFSAGLTAGAIDKTGADILGRAEKEWNGDPFLDDKSFKSWAKSREQVKEAVEGPKTEFIYSGFVEVNGKRMAVINGVEYGEGEALEAKGFTLKSISPSQAVIENNKLGAKINVPLME